MSLPDSGLSPPTTMPTLTELAEQLLVHVKTLESSAVKELPSASLESNIYKGLPTEVQASRTAAVDTAQLIRKLTLGPEGIATEIFHRVSCPNVASENIYRLRSSAGRPHGPMCYFS